MARNGKKPEYILYGTHYYNGIISSMICDDIQNIDRQQTGKKQKEYDSDTKVTPSSTIKVVNNPEITGTIPKRGGMMRRWMKHGNKHVKHSKRIQRRETTH
jgi:hypothetical protein